MRPKKALRKFVLLQGVGILTFSATAAFAGNVGVNLNINVGEPPRPVVVTPPPVVAPPPYTPPVETIRVEDDVQFIYPEPLGFYVAVGVPYDLVYVQNSYFLYRDGRWLQAPSSRGPWVVQRYRDLPPVLRRHRLERIRECRTREYAIYQRDREHYRGRHFRPGNQSWKDQHKEMKERRKEEKRFEKEARKGEHRLEKEARKDERRFEKEERHRRREGRDD